MTRHDPRLVARLYARTSNPNLALLLNRLKHVRPAGDSFRARCPVHQGKFRNSLKITPLGDGRILIHCHDHHCSPLEILMVCGLEMTDIIPERLSHNAKQVLNCNEL